MQEGLDQCIWCATLTNLFHKGHTVVTMTLGILVPSCLEREGVLDTTWDSSFFLFVCNKKDWTRALNFFWRMDWEIASGQWLPLNHVTSVVSTEFIIAVWQIIQIPCCWGISTRECLKFKITLLVESSSIKGHCTKEWGRLFCQWG